MSLYWHLISVIGCNRVELTRECVKSVFAAGGEFLLHCTDNGSTDGTWEYFTELSKNHGDRVLLKRNLTNEGFQTPNNQAFEVARKLSIPFFIALNNDCTVPLDWLQRFDDVFSRHPTCALSSHKSDCSVLREDFHGVGGDRYEYADGACLAVRVEFVARHFPYLFSPYLTMIYGEDSDLSLRMQRLGYAIFPANFVIQHVRQSTCKGLPQTKVWQEKNHAVLREKWKHWLRVRRFDYRILVKRQIASGDTLLTTPVIRALWEQNPQSEILVETNFPEIFKGNPCVTAAAQKVGRRDTDLVIDLDMVSENGAMRHFVTSYARAAGVGEVPHRTEVYFDKAQYPELTGRWCALHVGGTTWAGKNWPKDRFVEVIRRLRTSGWKVVLISHDNPDDSMPCDRDMRFPKLSVQQTAGVLHRCQLFVGLDSFPMHLAMAVGIPTVGIFGVTESKFIMCEGPQFVGCDADPLLAPSAGERHRIAGATMLHTDDSAICTVTVEQVMAGIERALAGQLEESAV